MTNERMTNLESMWLEKGKYVVDFKRGCGLGSPPPRGVRGVRRVYYEKESTFGELAGSIGLALAPSLKGVHAQN